MDTSVRLLVCLALASLGGCSSSSGKNVGSAVATLISAKGTSAELGKTGLLRITFDNPVAKSTDVTITTVDTANAKLPDHLTVPSGALAVEAPWTGLALGEFSLFLSSGDVTLQLFLKVVDHFQLSTIESDADHLEAGAITNLYVEMNATLPSPLPVTLSAADSTVVMIPTQVIVPAWSSEGSVPLTALAKGTTVVTGTQGSDQAAETFTVVDHARLLASGQFSGSFEVGATINSDLETDAVVGQQTAISATSSDPSVVAAPSGLAISANGTDLPISLTVMGPGQTDLTFTLADSTVVGHIYAVANASLVEFDLADSAGVGGTVSGHVQLDVNPSKPHTVMLSSSDPTILAVPALLDIPVGSATRYFYPTALKTGTVTITATMDSVTLTQLVYVSQSTVAPLSVDWGVSQRLMVGFSTSVSVENDAAPNGTVTLTSSNPSVIAVPASVSLDSGGIGTFQLNALKAGNTTITASASGATPVSLDLEVVTLPLLQLDDSYQVAVGRTSEFFLNLDAEVPQGTEVQFKSSNPAVVAAPPPVFATGPADSILVQYSGLQSGESILTASIGTSSASTVIYVGSNSARPPTFSGFSVNDSTLEVGAITTVFVGLNGLATSDTTITLSTPVSPMPAISLPQTSVVIAKGSDGGNAPVVALNPGSAIITASAGSVQLNTTVNVVAFPTYFMNLSSSVNHGQVLSGSVSADCLLSSDRVITLSSSDPATASVSPASVTLSLRNGNAPFTVTGVAASPGPVTITATPPSPSPGPVTQQVTVF
jgi:hypothetical protein